MARKVSAPWCSFALLLVFAQIIDLSYAATESEAIEFLRNLESQYSRECNKDMVARWNYIVNVTAANEQISVRTMGKVVVF